MDRKRLIERLLPIAGSVVMQLIAARTYAELRRQLRQARRLQEQMEEDHRMLVRSVIQVRNRLAPRRPVPYEPYGEEDMLDLEREGEDSGE